MVTITVKHLRTLTEKTIGLIGANPIYPVYFTTRWGIHTFGVLSPIDIVILDNNNFVVAMHPSMKPNRVFFWNPKYNRVVELPYGTISKKHIISGRQIVFRLKGI